MVRFQCKECDKSYGCKSSLKRHIICIHNINTIVYKCDECDKSYKNKGSLKIHILIKHNENVIVYKCDECNYITKRKEHLKRHINSKHNENAIIYKCVECAKTYKSKRSLKRHVNNIHNSHNENTTIYKCNKCDKSYKNKCTLINHLSVKHNKNAIIYKCKECTYKTKRKNDLNRHKEQVHDMGDHECEFCCYNRNSIIKYKGKYGISKICRKCYNKVTGKSSRIEHTWSNYLDKSIGTEFLASSDKSLIYNGGCSLKRPDKLYLGLNLVEVDELDEQQHKYYNPECEDSRISEIYDEDGICGKTLVVIRTNPDKYKNPEGYKKLKREERFKLHIKLKRYLRLNPPKEKIFIYYMFYNVDNKVITKNYPFKMIYSEKDFV